MPRPHLVGHGEALPEVPKGSCPVCGGTDAHDIVQLSESETLEILKMRLKPRAQLEQYDPDSAEGRAQRMGIPPYDAAPSEHENLPEWKHRLAHEPMGAHNPHTHDPAAPSEPLTDYQEGYADGLLEGVSDPAALPAEVGE